MTQTTTSNKIPRVPFVTHRIWDARHRMLCAPTMDLKLLWCDRYQKLKRLRGDYNGPEENSPG